MRSRKRYLSPDTRWEPYFTFGRADKSLDRGDMSPLGRGDIALPRGTIRVMRALLCTLALAATAVFASAAPAADAVLRPSLTVTASGPVVVSGARFKPRERVTLRFVVSGEPSLRVVRASAAGRLVARFLRSVPDCEGFTLSAVGSRGSRVFYREIPPPCGIVIQP
jgi:hypothetical protein